MKTLRRGDRGDQVKDLQRELNRHGAKPALAVDGDFGRGTEAAVESFQRKKKLYADGVAGSQTWAALKEIEETALSSHVATAMPSFQGRTKLEGFDQVVRPGAKPHGYTQATLRSDAAESMRGILAYVHSLGGKLSSAGGKRNLGVGGPNRAFCSLHKTGLALDFATYSAMVDPRKDPMICVMEPLGHQIFFRLYVRCTSEKVADVTLGASKWNNGKIETVETTGRFLDLTSLLESKGWTRIPKRGKSRGGLEFWHVQWTGHLLVGKTTYGELLKAFWPWDELEGAKEWTHYRDRTFTGFGF